MTAAITATCGECLKVICAPYISRAELMAALGRGEPAWAWADTLTPLTSAELEAWIWAPAGGGFDYCSAACQRKRENRNKGG